MRLRFSPLLFFFRPQLESFCDSIYSIVLFWYIATGVRSVCQLISMRANRSVANCFDDASFRTVK